MSALLGTTADWYLMRASGFVALILLTITVALGVSNVARLARGAWTRTVASFVHRNVSLLAVAFLVIHVLTAISDKYVKVPALALVVPGASRYDPLWIGLGALSVDLLIAVVVTSLLRSRIGRRTWVTIHWLAYLSWPSALIHAIGAGSGSGADTGAGWSTIIYVSCCVTFGAAVVLRLLQRGRAPADRTVRRPNPPAHRPPSAGLRPTTVPSGAPVDSRRPAAARHLSRPPAPTRSAHHSRRSL